MGLFSRRRMEQRVEKVEFKVIEIISVRRRFKERWAKGKFRELFTSYQKFPLTQSQVEAATSHARETMVVAGAGSGKTSLLIGRAKYLLESGRALPGQVLILAFNRKAAAELSERAAALNLEIEASTFHKFGKDTLEAHLGTQQVAFAEDHEVRTFIRRHFEGSSRDTELTAIAAKFFAGLMVPFKEFSEYRTLNEYKAYVSSMPPTLQGEKVKSHGEWLIANLLWTLAIPYEYEAEYKVGGKDFSHRPDFTISLPQNAQIYIEYFGVDSEGNTAPGIDAERYGRSREWKLATHKRNQTRFVELTYQDLKDGVLTRKLLAELRRYEVPIQRRDDKEVLSQANQHGYQTRFNELVRTFLQHARAQRIDIGTLKERSTDERTKAFLGLFEPLIKAYEDELRRLQRPDFSELIHAGADLIEAGEVTLPYTHVMIDEFQDIAHDRYRLVSAMQLARPSLEITYVGDDWQSIYAFAGSDVSIMRALSRPKMNRKRVDLGDTFRMGQTLASVASDFVMTNPSQLEKKIVSSFDHHTPLHFHWDTKRGEIETNLRMVIERIGEPAEDPGVELQVLARYRDNLPALPLVERLWNGPVTVDTVHKVKGLEADYVIVMDLLQDNRGFPSTIESDPILKLVLQEAELFPHAEERRLFYVAMTRARKEVHLVSPEAFPSLFAIELKEQGVGKHIGDVRDNSCPLCKTGRLVLSEKSNTFYCTNLPHCSLSTPRCKECDASARLISLTPLIYRCEAHPKVTWDSCPSCKHGVLITRDGRFGSFQSCHLWPSTRCPGNSRGKLRR